MKEVKISDAEKKQLFEMLEASRKYRLKMIRRGFYLIAAGLVASIILNLFKEISILNKLLVIAYLITVYGVYKSCWWYLGNFSIKKFEKDIKNGVKIVDESRIKRHFKTFREVKLANGFKIADFMITGPDWKVGDDIKYEYTPLDKHILAAEITKAQP